MRMRGCARHALPHPDPLPAGEGDKQRHSSDPLPSVNHNMQALTPTLSQRERENLFKLLMLVLLS
jgi:hypothetical protein